MTDQPFRRPGLREAARRGARADRPPQPAAPAAPSPPAPLTEPVRANCGHVVLFVLDPDGKDRFRDARRKRVTDRDCPECRRKAHEARTGAEMRAARERRAGKAKREAQAKDRLPDGSRFDGLLWDAGKGKWSGALTVPDPTAENGARVFTASASGLFRLLRTLDDLYRDSLAAARAGEVV